MRHAKRTISFTAISLGQQALACGVSYHILQTSRTHTHFFAQDHYLLSIFSTAISLGQQALARGLNQLSHFTNLHAHTTHTGPLPAQHFLHCHQLRPTSPRTWCNDGCRWGHLSCCYGIVGSVHAVGVQETWHAACVGWGAFVCVLVCAYVCKYACACVCVCVCATPFFFLCILIRD